MIYLIPLRRIGVKENRRTFSKSTKEVHESWTQLRMPPGVLPFLEALIIHFFSSRVPSLSEPWISAASSGAEISCIAIRKSAASAYAMENARFVSCERVEKELEEVGRSSAETLLGTACCEGAELMVLVSGKTRVTRASSCAAWSC
jgi:hypothetical protein